MVDVPEHEFDVFIIGGGINGTGIARDAAGRGLSVALAEMNDLASATSSSSTKLFHGGLRYLEYFEFRLVREALIEREVLLKAMPHISWPMRFVLPYHDEMRFENDTPASRMLSFFMPWMKGRRPAWMIRLGLFCYDHLGGRKILPGTSTLDLSTDPAGKPLRPKFRKAYEYSDCWVEDARLVVLNARDARANGAQIMTRTKVVSAKQANRVWQVQLQDQITGAKSELRAKVLINAGGPWVGEIAQDKMHVDTRAGVRLVRGSHIVTRSLFDHGKCYFFQGTDGRIIFAIPYEQDFTLIGTTDADHEDPDITPVCTEDEKKYLLDFASSYFAQPLVTEDIVWSYSGVRPLYDDGSTSATAATREYVLQLDEQNGAAILNVFGGKITTYRKLAEAAIAKVNTYFPQAKGDWTAGAPLPGGDFPTDGFDTIVERLRAAHPYLDATWARRLARAYGTEAADLLGETQSVAELGRDFGATITQRELDWSIANEWTKTGEDFVWRRSKLGLRLTESQITAIDDYIRSAQSG